MKDRYKTKQQLIDELAALRRRLAQYESVRAEGQIKSEARFRDYFKLQSIGVAITSPDKRWIEINDKLCEILGYSREELFQTSWAALTHPDDLAANLDLFNQAISGKIDEYYLDKRFIRKDGSLVYVHLSVRSVRKADGQLDYFLTVYEDITKRKRAEEALRESEEHFRNLIEGSIEGVLIHQNWKPLFVNQAYTDILGYASPDEILAMKSIASFIAPHERARLQHYREARMKGKDVPTDYEYDAVRKDGTPVVLRNLVRVVNWKGQRALQNTVIDVTERKRAEGALRRYEHIVSASSDLMAFVDTGYNYQAANAAYLEAVGKTKDEVIGHSVVEILGTEIFEHRIKPHLDRCLSGKNTHYQHWLDLPGLGRRYLDVHYDPFYEADGSVSGVLVDVRDITEHKRAETALRVSEERYRALYDGNPSMYFTVDPEGIVLSVNTFGAEQLGYVRDELVGMSILQLIHKDDGQKAKQKIDDLMHTPGQLHRWEIRQLHKTGSVLWARASGRAIDDAEGRQVILLVCEDITAARQLSEELTYQASHDALTGLFNRREFDGRLQRVLQNARAGPMVHALCYLDLDQFKVINDICGHVAGDQLLRQMGQVLKGKIRQGDTLARLGGDEFGLLLEHCSLENAKRVADEVQKAIQDFRFVWEGRSVRIGVSIGLVPIGKTSENVTSLLGKADAACYAAKDAGRNRIHVYHESDTDLAKRHGEMQLVSRINQALERDHFHLAFQPIAPVRKKDARGEHYELLIRMEDDKGRIVPPHVFLAAAERYNLSTKVDHWVISTAFQWLICHPQQLERLFLCSTNLSGHSLGDEHFLEFIVQQFGKTQLPPEKICFEVTETAAIANFSSAARFIHALKDLGCRFALDDFGSGLSSFAYLKNLPVDFIKIDGVFVKDIVDDPIALAMVHSINEIAQVMGKQTIAEFVESETILEKLRGIGVDYAQGYGVGRPQPIEAMI